MQRKAEGLLYIQESHETWQVSQLQLDPGLGNGSKGQCLDKWGHLKVCSGWDSNFGQMLKGCNVSVLNDTMCHCACVNNKFSYFDSNTMVMQENFHGHRKYTPSENLQDLNQRADPEPWGEFALTALTSRDRGSCLCGSCSLPLSGAAWLGAGILCALTSTSV